MNKENKARIYRLIISLCLLLTAIFVNTDEIVRLVIFIITYLVVSYKVLLECLENILKLDFFNEDFLMTIASIGAFVLGDYAEAVAIMLLFQVGELFEDLAIDHSEKSISTMLEIRPQNANLLSDGEEKTVPCEEVNIDDIIIVKAGERIPLDGEITEGNSSLDTSALTGESLPRDVKVGDIALSGSINLSGNLQIKVNKKYSESTISKIVELLKETKEKQSKHEGYIEKVAKIYTPVVIGLALLLAVIPPLFTGLWIEWIKRGISILIISCPCSVVVSVPLAFFCSIGRASKEGILIKGGVFIELLSKSKIFAFDKTGTITEGKFEIETVKANEISNNELLEIASAVEGHSNHPIAKAIAAAGDKQINKIDNVIEKNGLGIFASLNGDDIFVGNSAYLQQNNIAYDLYSGIGSVVYVCRNNNYIGYISVIDKLKDNAQKAIKSLKKGRIEKCVMLSGDRKPVAEKIASMVGIDEAHAELLPQDKLTELEKLKDAGITCYVGDGINDAPVLSGADVGISMGKIGSDIAIDSADVVIMDDNLDKLPYILRLSGITMRKVRENIFFSLFVKILIFVITLLMGNNMYLAIAADVGTLIACIINSIMLLKK